MLPLGLSLSGRHSPSPSLVCTLATSQVLYSQLKEEENAQLGLYVGRVAKCKGSWEQGAWSGAWGRAEAREGGAGRRPADGHPGEAQSVKMLVPRVNAQ